MKKYNNISNFVFFVAMLMLFQKTRAQQQNLPLNSTFSFSVEKRIIENDSIKHFGLFPLLQSRFDQSIFEEENESLVINQFENRSFFFRKSFLEHFIQYESDEVQFTIDPLVNFELGQENSEFERDQQLYKNTRGFLLRVNLGNKVSIESSFKENQVELPSYLYEQVSKSRSAYGQGRVKKFKETGFDFAMASSTISYSPSKKVNIQAGHGKHFVGYGHRSLLMSDVAFNYPFIKINSTWLNGKLEYQNLYTIFQNLVRLDSKSLSEGLLERKQGGFHFLDYAVNSKFNIALFEGVIWPSMDSSGNVNVPVNYWAPVIFLNSILDGDAEKGNNLVGINWSYRPFKSINFYGQLAKFGLSDNYTAFQLGVKHYSKILPLRFQLEYNSTLGLSRSNLFNHHSESLTSPVGLNSEEIYGEILFKKKRIITKLSGNQIKYDSNEILFLDVKQSYIVNSSYDLTFSIGVNFRSDSNLDNKVNYFYAGLSTNLQNLYFNY